jgi:hypothetical protein
MHFDPINRKWLLVILVALVPSVWGAIIPVSLAQLVRPRAHHTPKLWNEVVAKHQFAYVAYFFAISFAAKFTPDNSLWILSFNQAAILLAFLFHYFSVKSTVHQDLRIDKFHPAKACPAACSYSLNAWAFIRLCGWKLLAAAILLSIAICDALWAIA